ncbi:hypothetical protein K493DRAFT_297913 [Basidiobolus meristosporus CBS 931.73]|uniref:Uncharacterized protein n=1 Tax=Basidiobolus meristosporus CBS 931.73 TaxID=1314790 RepID=A0A1Y1YWG0_9FUNG|nr:hypothetical protein K493DRAFT_297913 [Basidiobolus meristosporus CBS 931.73]|eukprot:ORY02392.1 hypothetical protein K493DRAFT_297913 [Basidiobolus meristosporus CBS 931.73]
MTEEKTGLHDSEASGIPDLDIAKLQPTRALMDKVKGHSSDNPTPTSLIRHKSLIKLYINPNITQPAAQVRAGGYKKHKKSARCHFKTLVVTDTRQWARTSSQW